MIYYILSAWAGFTLGILTMAFIKVGAASEDREDARFKLQQLINSRATSFEVQQYAKRRAAALKGIALKAGRK